MSPPPAKKSKQDYHSHFFKKKGLVEAGQRGFLATCNYQEKGCIRECYTILAHYANFIYGAECAVPPVFTDTDDENDFDISDELQLEVTVAQQEKSKNKNARFIALETGAINTVFIRTTLPDPVKLAWFIVRDIYNKGFRKTRSLIRLIPIEVVCSASSVQAIVNAVHDVFDKHFLQAEPCTYSIVVNRRLNNSIDRDTVIRALAGIVFKKNPIHKVDLRNPDKTVVLEIIKGVCMIGILPSYFKYKKYNLDECGRPHPANDGDFEVTEPTEAERLVVEEESMDSLNEEVSAGEETAEIPVVTATGLPVSDSPESPEEEKAAAAAVANVENQAAADNNVQSAEMNIDNVDLINQDDNYKQPEEVIAVAQALEDKPNVPNVEDEIHINELARDLAVFVNTVAETISKVEGVEVTTEAVYTEENAATETTEATEDNEATETKEATDAYEASETKEDTETKEATDANEASETTEATEDNEATETKEATEASETKEATETNEASETKEATDANETKKANEAKEATEANEATETKEAIEAKEANETTEATEANETKEANKVDEKQPEPEQEDQQAKSDGKEAKVEKAAEKKEDVMNKDVEENVEQSSPIHEQQQNDVEKEEKDDKKDDEGTEEMNAIKANTEETTEENQNIN